ncbi:phosphatase PAP2 family protein [Bacillus alkalicellulosilyticus]|uniref:phosphatase PAP2 family protein n=1 Tax=Alkalihalobacterium alkalicellulosilyticum TaxID=1912214 RepID=UPI000997D867|nr:phosphatase PAP2 family protein [Bacillus alkalicellulosilyticus]
MRYKKKLSHIIIVCFLLFLLLSFLSVYNQLKRIDGFLIDWFLAITPNNAIIWFEYITMIGAGEPILLLTLGLILLLLYKKHYSEVVLFLSVTFGGLLLNLFLKMTFQRERPGEMHVIDVFGYSLEIASYSFPSGHTMRSVLLFSLLIYISHSSLKRTDWKITITSLSILAIILVSISRIVVGAHFPSDIFAAIFAAIGWFTFCIMINENILSLLKYRLRVT